MNLNSNLFEVNDAINGQLRNSCGCFIKPIDPLNPVQFLEGSFKTSKTDLFSNDITINTFYESENIDSLIGNSQGINLEDTNFKENSDLIRNERIINSEFENIGTVGEKEIFIQLESPFQAAQTIGIFNPQGQIVGVQDGGVTVIEIEYISGDISRLTFPTENNFFIDLFFDPISNVLSGTDSRGNNYQANLDPITGNISQVSVNLDPTFVPPFDLAACVAAATAFFVAIGKSYFDCRQANTPPQIANCLASLSGLWFVALPAVIGTCGPL